MPGTPKKIRLRRIQPPHDIRLHRFSTSQSVVPPLLARFAAVYAFFTSSPFGGESEYLFAHRKARITPTSLRSKGKAEADIVAAEAR